MYKVILFIGLWCLTVGGVGAQAPQLSRKNRDLEEKALKAWEQRDLEKAAGLYRQLIENEPQYLPGHLRLAQVYEWQKHSDLVEQHYRRAVELAPEAAEVMPAYQWLAKKAQLEEKYDLSAGYWKKVIALTAGQKPNNLVRLAQRQLEAAEFAQKAKQNPSDIKRVPLSDTVNRLPMQFFPVLTADEETLIFTGFEKGGDENIYISSKENGHWSVPESLSDRINTTSNEGTCTISADGHTLVFTGCNRHDGLGSCDLYITYLKNGQWSDPKGLGEPVNSRFWESQPSLSADGSVLYFASDRPGGVGKSDIWKTEKAENGNWGTPVNLGDIINTAEDENAPFVHANGRTLFYASKGLPGMGNFDIFMIDLQNTGTTKPVNLGYPINNSADQVGMFITSDGETAYYTEDRTEPEKGRLSKLYTFALPKELKPLFVPTRYLKGRVLDSETGNPLKAELRLYDLATQQLVSGFTSDETTGEYLAVVNKDSHYALYVERSGYLFKSMSFDVNDSETSVKKDIRIERVKKDKAEILTNVFFDTGDFRLSDKSKLELDKLVAFLEQNNNLVIEVSGHTDDVGSETDNLKLSEKRAESVVSYLTARGVSASRLQFKGYGENVPKLPNDSDKNRSENRRIEWRIL